MMWCQLCLSNLTASPEQLISTPGLRKLKSKFNDSCLTELGHNFYENQ
jgi:hypothetical protein